MNNYDSWSNPPFFTCSCIRWSFFLHNYCFFVIKPPSVKVKLKRFSKFLDSVPEQQFLIVNLPTPVKLVFRKYHIHLVKKCISLLFYPWSTYKRNWVNMSVCSRQPHLIHWIIKMHEKFGVWINEECCFNLEQLSWEFRLWNGFDSDAELFMYHT